MDGVVPGGGGAAPDEDRLVFWELREEGRGGGWEWEIEAQVKDLTLGVVGNLPYCSLVIMDP